MDTFKSFVNVSVIALLLCGTSIVLGVTSPSTYVFLTDESQGAEILTALFYIIAGVGLLTISWKQYRKNINTPKQLILPVLLGLFFIFVGGEEESWGQWILGFEPPEAVAAVNYQQELTIHNLGIFTGLLHAHVILNLFVVGYGIILPFLYRFVAPIASLCDKLNCPVVPIQVAPLFAAALVYEKAARIIHVQVGLPQESLWRHTEMMEFFFAIGFLAFVLMYIARKEKQ